jgi:hypothetical protein
LIWIFFKNPKRADSGLSTKEKIAKIDLLGAFFLISGLVSLLLVLQWVGVVYKWSNSKVWGCMLGFGLLIAVFIAFQFRRNAEYVLIS